MVPSSLPSAMNRWPNRFHAPNHCRAAAGRQVQIRRPPERLVGALMAPLLLRPDGLFRRVREASLNIHRNARQEQGEGTFLMLVIVIVVVSLLRLGDSLVHAEIEDYI